MTDPLSAILGLGLLGVACLAFTEKILPLPPSHVLLLFLGMTAAPDLSRLAVLLLVTTLSAITGCLVWYSVGRRIGPDRADRLVERFGKYVCLRYATYSRLAEAYRRLVKVLPDYQGSTGDGLVPGLASLYRKGRASEDVR